MGCCHLIWEESSSNLNQNNNIWNEVEFQRNCVEAVQYGTETLSFSGPKFREMLPKRDKVKVRSS